MVAAFMGTLEAAWLVADQDEREAVYGRFYRAMAASVLDDDGGYVEVAEISGRIYAAAVWYDYSHFGTSAIVQQDWDALLTAACGVHAERFRLLDATFASYRPAVSHFYLAWIGVRPDRQGVGLGSALLAHRHADLDDVAIPSYAVAPSHACRRLFARHGYQDGRKIPFYLPANGPAMWPMWRDPTLDSKGVS
ncbi:GNAT family N-acetyltransferase [Phytohabitans rumicis]|nr:N-acetyltransferase [Phytohabitans rumicis]